MKKKIKEKILHEETKGLDLTGKGSKNHFIFSYNDIDEIIDITIDRVLERIEKIILKKCGEYGLDILSKVLLDEIKELK